MELSEIPASVEIPAAVVAIIGVLSPYVIALVNNPRWSPNSKRVLAVVGSLVLTVLGLAGYYIWTREPVPELVPMLILGLVVSQATFALIAKPSAARLERATSPQLH